MTIKAPTRKVAHLTTPGYRAGNSARGRTWAKNNGYKWIDNDLQITKGGTLVNCHWPRPYRDKFLPYSDRRKLSNMTWSQVRKLRSPEGYRINSYRWAIYDAARKELNVEIEVKVASMTEAQFEELAGFCKQYYGTHWRQHVVIKILSTIAGYDAASRCLHRAKNAGFPTMILLRGVDRWRKVDVPWIDYERGSLR